MTHLPPPLPTGFHTVNFPGNSPFEKVDINPQQGRVKITLRSSTNTAQSIDMSLAAKAGKDLVNTLRNIQTALVTAASTPSHGATLLPNLFNSLKSEATFTTLTLQNATLDKVDLSGSTIVNLSVAGVCSISNSNLNLSSIKGKLSGHLKIVNCDHAQAEFNLKGQGQVEWAGTSSIKSLCGSRIVLDRDIAFRFSSVALNNADLTGIAQLSERIANEDRYTAAKAGVGSYPTGNRFYIQDRYALFSNCVISDSTQLTRQRATNQIYTTELQTRLAPVDVRRWEKHFSNNFYKTLTGTGLTGYEAAEWHKMKLAFDVQKGGIFSRNWLNVRGNEHTFEVYQDPDTSQIVFKSFKELRTGQLDKKGGKTSEDLMFQTLHSLNPASLPGNVGIIPIAPVPPSTLHRVRSTP